MRLFDLIFSHKFRNSSEPFLEPIFRNLRFGIAYSDLKLFITSKTRILDYGCGPEAQFLNYLLSQDFKFTSYTGFEPGVPLQHLPVVGCNFISNSKDVHREKYDLVTMFAVLEHLPYPNFDYAQIAQSLRPGGILLLTTPSPRAKPILEFLSYQLGIISRREIEEHQHYFKESELRTMFRSHGLYPLKSTPFELGYNTYVVYRKSGL